jgi:hypothetical protein
LRHFGLLVGGVLVALGLFFLVRQKAYYLFFLLPGGALVVSGLLFPKALKHVYIAWMTMAIVLGFVVARVILTLFFFLVVTPIGWICRLAGKDFLRLKLDPNVQTYWIPRRRRKAESQEEYEQQF